MKIGQLPNAFASTDESGAQQTTKFGDLWDIVTYNPIDLIGDNPSVDDMTKWLQESGLNVLFILLGIGGLTYLAFKSLK